VVPEVSATHEWDDLESLVAGLDCCFVLDPAAVRRGLTLPPGTSSVGILIGPEGGWEESEMRVFESLGYTAVTLGERILRVETAAVVGAAALLVTPSVDTL
jgi:16S rRNA (uracil1498-N3)-methyltransferase